MVNAYGVISEQTGSHTLAMLPLAGLCLAGGIAVLFMGRRYSQPAGQEKPVAINKQGGFPPFQHTLFFYIVKRFAEGFTGS